MVPTKEFPREVLHPGLPPGVHIVEAGAVHKADEQTSVERPSRCKICEVCRGSGEVETGIGMMVCDNCNGCGKTRPASEAVLEPEFEPLLKMSNEYASLMLQWRLAVDGSQEIANLHATFRAKARDAAKLFENGLVRRLIEAYLREKRGET